VKLLLATALLLAAPALAQSPPPPDPQARAYRFQRGDLASVSPEGRRILAQAIRGSREDRAAVMAARDRINQLAAADQLDVAALRRAMAEERRLVDAQHARRQAALLEAFQKLSAADRKAFAERALRGRAMAEERAAEWRRRVEGGAR
jgi:uncharacterized membrane protein